MRTDEISASLHTLFTELVRGSSPHGAFILNPNDAGLLRSLDRLSAEDASAARDGGATIAAHVAHLTYGLSLLNRWAAGENPFADADWSAAWRTGAVSSDEWRAIRDDLARETQRWNEALGRSQDVSPVELNGMIASVAHLAYHFGAIRQISPATRGPRDSDAQPGG